MRLASTRCKVSEIPIDRGQTVFPRAFWSSYEFLIHYRSEDPRARQPVVSVVFIMWTVENGYHIFFLFAHNPIYLKHSYDFEECSVIGIAPNHIPLEYRCLIKMSDQITHVYLYIGKCN